MKIPNQWTFHNKEIAKNFNKHVREQLPWYELATQGVVHIARHYIPKNGLVYDLGASTGNIGNAIKDILKSRNANLIAIENSKEMVDLYNCHYGKLECYNVQEYNYNNFDLCISFLCLMFIEPKYRKDLLSKLYSKLNIGGCIIIFDKIESNGGYIGTINYRLTLAEKLKTTHAEEIINKELSLQGIQRPINYQLIKEYNPQLFFRFSDFVGYIIEKI
jgi:tRNA (cmo5U34)-methyltransferase|tara:strand:- start:97 stop:750 length:654 start_codon:yes stop_codon:yes gene_type:complete